MFGDLLRDEPMGLNPCSDSIDDLLMVWEPMQLVSGASQRSATVQPHTRAVLGKKEQWTRCSEVAQFVPRRSTEAGAPIKDRDQEQSGEGRSQDQVPNLQKSSFRTTTRRGQQRAITSCRTTSIR